MENVALYGDTQSEPRRDLAPLLIAVGFALTVAMGLAAFGYVMGVIRLGLILLGLLAAIVFMVKPDLATACVIFVIWSNAPFIAVKLHNTSAALAGSFVLLFCPALLRDFVVLRKPVRVNRVLILMLLYFVAQVASAVLSDNPSDSLSRLGAYVVEGVGLYFIVINVVRNRGALRRGIWAILVVGAIIGSMSIYQRKTGDYYQTFGGFAQQHHVDLEGMTGGMMQPMAGGPVGDKNYYAQILLVVLMLAMLQLWAERSAVAKLCAAAVCAITAGAIATTYSRATLVAFAIVLVLMRVMRYIRTWHLVAGAMAVLLVVIIASPGSLQHAETLSAASNSMRNADPAIQGRATENLAVFRMFMRYPLFGIGTGQAILHTAQYGNQGGYARIVGARPGHNLYLEELANTGIVGFSIFAAIVTVTLTDLLRVRRFWRDLNPGYAATMTAFIMGVIAFLVSGIFLSLYFIRYFWLLMALAGAAAHIYGAEALERTQLPLATSTPGVRSARPLEWSHGQS
jgi:putative inorganic carbon (hco3(-)) transporter